MNSTPKRALQVTPAQPAGARNQAAGTTRRSGRPDKPVHTTRRPDRRAAWGSQARQPGRPGDRAQHQQSRAASGSQARQPGRPGAERVAQLAIGGLTALAQLLNAIHRIRTGPGA